MSRLLWLAALLCLPTTQASEPPRPNPKQPVDYVKWVNEELGKDVAENAADAYQQALSAFAADEDLNKLVRETDAKKWTDAQRAGVRGWAEKNAKGLEQFAAAARMPKCFFRLKSESGSLLGVMLPELPTIRAVAVLTAARARLRLLEGNVDGALDDAATLLQVSRHMQAQPFLIQYLVGSAVGTLAYDVLLDVPRLSSGPVGYEQVITKLKRFDHEPAAPTRQVQMEKLSAWDFAQRFVKDSHGDGRYDTMVLPKEARELGLPEGSSSLDPPQTLDAIVNEISEYFDQWGPVFAADYQKARTLGGALEGRVAGKKNSVLGMISPAFSRVAVVHRRLIASRNAVRVVLELHAYQAKNGAWPADLDQALSESTARTALDPFSGQPFIYRLKDGQPLLYCVSENGSDDHGEVFRKEGKPGWGETGDYIFWPPQKE